MRHRHYAGIATRFARNRRHLASFYPARDDPIEEGQVAVHVQRQPMQRDPAADPHANRRNLARADPHAGELVAAAGADSINRKRVYDSALQRPQIRMNVARRTLQRHNRVGDQLPGAMVGDLPAARDPVHRNPRRSEQKLLIGTASQCEHVRMLQQQQGIADSPRMARGNQRVLQAQCLLVIDSSKPGGVQRSLAHNQKLIASPSAASAASITVSDSVGWGWTVRPNSRVVASSVFPNVTSEIRSVAPWPMIWQPITSPYFLPATSLTKPSTWLTATA